MKLCTTNLRGPNFIQPIAGSVCRFWTETFAFLTSKDTGLLERDDERELSTSVFNGREKPSGTERRRAGARADESW